MHTLQTLCASAVHCGHCVSPAAPVGVGHSLRPPRLLYIPCSPCGCCALLQFSHCGCCTFSAAPVGIVCSLKPVWVLYIHYSLWVLYILGSPCGRRTCLAAPVGVVHFSVDTFSCNVFQCLVTLKSFSSRISPRIGWS